MADGISAPRESHPSGGLPELLSFVATPMNAEHSSQEHFVFLPHSALYARPYDETGVSLCLLSVIAQSAASGLS